MKNNNYGIRCSICGNVNDPSISNNLQDHNPNLKFFDDDKDPTKTFCNECESDHEDTMAVWHIIDELNQQEESKMNKDLTFQYYKRGKGELDSSNFDDLVENGCVTVDNLDDKTFVALTALNIYVDYLTDIGSDQAPNSPLVVNVKGYVHNMRSDKDLFPTLELYALLYNFIIVCDKVQHTSNETIVSPQIARNIILNTLKISKALMLGADSSVIDFLPSVDLQASKIRKDGVVTHLTLDNVESILSEKDIVIVDDILGGGATIQMLVDLLYEYKYEGNLYLWVQYNEGIHSKELLDSFKKYYIGNLIGE